MGGAPSATTLLRFITCGQVDDGKSTLIGRLLYDAGMLHADQIDALRADSRRHGTRGDDLDFALLLDGLQAEREQGITIDVAYRYFESATRKYIVADAPGHEQYTRNMVSGASTADLALLLVDAAEGLRPQTRRHTLLLSLLGVRQLVLVVNKMDRVGFAQPVYASIDAALRAFALALGFDSIAVVPVVAVDGDNVVRRSARMPWYDGASVLELLEAAPVAEEAAQALPLRLPVQLSVRPDAAFRGVAGTLHSGSVRVGQRVRVLPSGLETTVQRIIGAQGDCAHARAGQAVTLSFADDVDVSRGDLVCASDAAAQVADQFEATLIWLDEAPLLRGRSYLLKCGTRTAGATVAPLKYRIDVDTAAHLAASRLQINEIGVAAIELDRPLAFDPYRENRATGAFVLIDRLSQRSVAAGMLHFALRRSHNLHWQAHTVDRPARAALKGQQACVVWFTGLSGAGKSTIADRLERRLHALGHHTYLLDGDNVRHGLNRDLGFTDADRVENIRRVTEVAALMADAGLIVLTAFISPFRSERLAARQRLEAVGFVEVFVDAPLAVAEQRDPKGLYRKARAGTLRNFTGIDSPYEPPEAPELRLDSANLAADACVDAVLRCLRERGCLPATP
jgi:bifunctional enzyme CysN/CysC